VLLLLCADAAGFRIPFIKRPLYSGMHSGQISLPGGKAEEGETPVQTALREASEEIGVDPALVKVAGTLTDFYVIPSNILVTPVVGVVPCRPVYRPDAQEVVKVIEGNLADLLADDAVKEKEIEVGGLYRMLAPHFEVEGEVVWGATAMILNEFRMVMNELRASV
jgi:8-oxo-dGTP pyrophosphatase MutT (NUDIX family)